MPLLRKLGSIVLLASLAVPVAACERAGTCGPYGESSWDAPSQSARIRIWALRIPSAPILRQVATHELGHAMGLLQPQGGNIHDTHSTNPSALMYPTVADNLRLTGADVAAYRAAHTDASERWQVLVDPACSAAVVEATLDGVALWHTSVGAQLDVAMGPCEARDHVICVGQDDDR